MSLKIRGDPFDIEESTKSQFMEREKIYDK